MRTTLRSVPVTAQGRLRATPRMRALLTPHRQEPPARRSQPGRPRGFVYPDGCPKAVRFRTKPAALVSVLRPFGDVARRAEDERATGRGEPAWVQRRVAA